MKRGFQSKISDELIKNDLIEYFSWNPEMREISNNLIFRILQITQNLFLEYKEAGIFDYKPSHDEVLTKILLTLEESLSVETPVWTRNQQKITDFMFQSNKIFNFAYKRSLTGHIDILFFSEANQSLIVADYKPEGGFLRSLPQVATYGLLLKRILSITVCL